MDLLKSRGVGRRHLVILSMDRKALIQTCSSGEYGQKLRASRAGFLCRDRDECRGCGAQKKKEFTDRWHEVVVLPRLLLVTHMNSLPDT
jgi:hypothetical protein